jgi:Uma2 family endonuclease
MYTYPAGIPIPPPEGFTIDDLAELDLPRHTQLIHGGLYVNAAPATWHNLLAAKLGQAIEAVATDAVVLPGQAIEISEHHAPEPDILVIKRKAFREDLTAYPPHAVILAIEVMSTDKRKDQVVRPEEYADAGIPHVWRIERTAERELVGYTYELEPLNNTYTPTGVHHRRLSTEQPWPLECDLQKMVTP